MRKNPALQDSPPAADGFSNIIPLHRSAILPGNQIPLISFIQILFNLGS